ncbi:MAG TPA: glycosyltransferase family 39 protein [Candidatus Nanoarchaeia archaeon]|nr:glycosyltransferase family 39 protein [Candidatus Nanoarchaeia archaeon]
MKKYAKILLFGFIILVLVKLLLVLAISSPSIFSDEYYYSKLARSFFFNNAFSIHNELNTLYPPLYPIAISSAYIFTDMKDVYLLMKLINVLLITSIIFPMYFLLKEFLSRKQAVVSSLVISFLPVLFLMPIYIMAENLFYPLIIWAIFFLYKSQKEKSKLYPGLTGIAIGLCFLTKVLGITLFLVPISLVILNKFLKKQTLSFSKLAIIYIFALLIISPWIIFAGMENGFTLQGILGVYAKEATSLTRHSNFTLTFINWIFSYLAYIIAAIGIFPLGLWITRKIPNEKKPLAYLLITAISLFLLVVAYSSSGGPPDPVFSWFSGRPIGRYIEGIVPLALILAYLLIESSQKEFIKKKHIYITSLVVSLTAAAFIAQLTLASLFPANNISLTLLGVGKSILGRLIYGSLSANPYFSWLLFLTLSAIIVIISSILIYIWALRKLNIKHLHLFFTAIFIITIFAGYAAIYYNTTTYWQNNEQLQLSEWINSNNKITDPKLLIDEYYQGKLGKASSALYERDGKYTSSIIGFWVNGEITIGNIQQSDDFDYIITKGKINKKLLRETPSGIKLYTNEN